MPGVLDELKKLTAFARSFFAALALFVLALPLLADLASALPYSPKPEGTVKLLAVIVGLIAISGPYLSTLAGHRQLRSKGILWLLAAIGLILFFLLLAPEPGREPTSRENWLLLCNYLGIYFALASGLVELSLYAYALKRHGQLPDAVAQPFWKDVRRRFRSWRRERSERLEKERAKKAREEMEEKKRLEREKEREARSKWRRFRYALLWSGVVVLGVAGFFAFRLYAG